MALPEQRPWSGSLPMLIDTSFDFRTDTPPGKGKTLTKTAPRSAGTTNSCGARSCQVGRSSILNPCKGARFTQGPSCRFFSGALLRLPLPHGKPTRTSPTEITTQHRVIRGRLQQLAIYSGVTGTSLRPDLGNSEDPRTKINDVARVREGVRHPADGNGKRFDWPLSQSCQAGDEQERARVTNR